MLDAWCLLFSGCAIIANHETPCHQDVGSRHEWYDVICTMGSYGTTTARLPGLTAGFDYYAGTAIALCGWILAHKVDKHKDGDHICFVWFMRDNIEEYIGISPGKGSQGESLLKRQICSGKIGKSQILHAGDTMHPKVLCFPEKSIFWNSIRIDEQLTPTLIWKVSDLGSG